MMMMMMMMMLMLMMIVIISIIKTLARQGHPPSINHSHI